MSLIGKTAGKTLRGKINHLKTVVGYSAYEVAVINGFSGTEEEWLASLKGEDGLTPYIGENDNWWIGEEDTGVKAATGEDIATLQQQVADLMYEPITINSLSISPSRVEIGSKINEVTATWTLNKEPVSQTFDGEEVPAADRRTVITSDGGWKNNIMFVLTAKDERNLTVEKSAILSFINGVYHGVLENGTELTSAAVLTLAKKLQSSKGITFTANAGATQRIAYALPKSYGTPSFKVGGFDGGFSLAATIDFTNASDYTESYNVWLSDNTGLGSTTVVVS